MLTHGANNSRCYRISAILKLVLMGRAPQAVPLLAFQAIAANLLRNVTWE